MLVTPMDKLVAEVRKMLQNATQTAFTCSTPTMETLEQYVFMFKVNN